MPLNIITSAEGDWFHSMTPDMQKQYLDEHPTSKYAKQGSASKDDKESVLKSVNKPGPNKHPAVVHKGEQHAAPISKQSRQIIQKLPKPVQSFFHTKQYEPNSPVRKKLATFAHNSVHLLVKSVVDEVKDWKNAASALKDLAGGAKYHELDHEKKEGLKETAKFIATVAFTVGFGAAMEGGTEALGALFKSGVGVALAREAMTHTLAKSGANAVVHASYARRASAMSYIKILSSTDDEDQKVLAKFIMHFADSLQHADINPNSLVPAVMETSMLHIIKSTPIEIAEKWSQGVTEKEKTHTPPGLFTESADKIASWMYHNSDSLRQAIGRISFYQNRAGDKISAEDKRKFDLAKDKVRKLFGKE